MKISFMLPKKSKIIVFGLTSDEVVEIFESNNINYTIYNELSRNININPIFVIKYFFNIIKCFRSYKILSLVWHYSNDADTHTVETHIYRLRKKVDGTFSDVKFILNNKDGYYI